MCRMLYTIEHGAITPKPAAAAWAKQRLDPRWKGLTDKAAAWRNDLPFDDLDAVLDLLRYTINRSQAERRTWRVNLVVNLPRRKLLQHRAPLRD